MKRLGIRIKIKREALKLPLGEVARMAGISASALSQIENAKAFPSIITLKGIANALNSTVGELVGENETITGVPLVRYDEKVFVTSNESGAEMYSLSNRQSGQQMVIYLIVLKKESNTDGFLKEHSGQEFCHLIKGELSFEIDETNYIMKSGDSLYYNSARKHRGVNHKSTIAELIWVVTPPEF